jgi:hypothetical protein
MQQTFNVGRRLCFGVAAASEARYAPEVTDAANSSTPSRLSHQLRFASLIDASRALFFPCDHRGEVRLDGLDECARNNYFFARNARHDYGPPSVVAVDGDSKTH